MTSSQPWAITAVFKYEGTTDTTIKQTILAQTKNQSASHGRVILRFADGDLQFKYGDWDNNWTFDADASEFPENEWHAVYIDYNGGNTHSDYTVRFRIRKIDLLSGDVSEPAGTWTVNGTGYTGSIDGIQHIAGLRWIPNLEWFHRLSRDNNTQDIQRLTY